MPNDGVTPRPAKGREQRIRGVNGFIKWHYFTACEVRSYTATRDAQGRWTLACYIVNADAYKMKQTPLRFVAPFETGEWRWMIETIDVRDSACTATLGPQLP